jgi:hypothetical protein
MMKALAALLILVAVLRAGAADAPPAPEAAGAGDPVERAVERGLAYLAGIQDSGGFFPEEYGRTTGVVSLGGMAFLAKGYLPGRPPYGDVLNRCIDYVVANQMENGLLAKPDQRMYSHAISTLFLCEVSGMVDPARQAKLDDVLPKAVKLILAAQAVPNLQRQRHVLHRLGAHGTAIGAAQRRARAGQGHRGCRDVHPQPR